MCDGNGVHKFEGNLGHDDAGQPIGSGMASDRHLFDQGVRE